MNGILKLKDRILEELLGELDDHEAERLKPKAASMEIDVEKDPGEAAMTEHDGSRPSDANPMQKAPGATEGDEDDLNDDDLKALLAEYMK